MSARRKPVEMPSPESSTSAVEAITAGDSVAPSAYRLLSRREAERLTDQIRFQIESIDNGYFKLRNLLEEAKNSNVWQMLQFASWPAYFVSLFEGRPLRLPVEERRELTRYMHGEGLSVRTIAPIMGASVGTVHADITAGVQNRTPAADPVVSAPTSPPHDGASVDTAETRVVRTVTGLDGKIYTPKPSASKPLRPVLAGDDLARFDAEKNAKSLGDMLGSLDALTVPEHRERVLSKWWPAGSDAVAPTKRDLLTPARLRDFATALLAFADELEAWS